MTQTNNPQYAQYSYQMPPQAPQPPVPPPMPPRETKNKFLTFVLGLIPGAGQMYHGLLKRGVSIMLLFWGVMAVSALTYLGVLNFLLPVVWFYSFFDTVNRMNLTLDELKMIPDDYIIFGGLSKKANPETPGGRAISGLVRGRHLLFGWGLILLAVWIFLNGFFSSSFFYYFAREFLAPDAYGIINGIVDLIPILILPIFCIVIGIRLIAGGGGKPTPKYYDEYTVPTDGDNGGRK